MPKILIILVIIFLMMRKKTSSILYTSGLGNSNLPRGLRNNNPFNLVKSSIKWDGKKSQSTDSSFEQFDNYFVGLRAGMLDLTNDINKGKNDLNSLMHEFAPKHGNDTTGYINTLAKSLGLSPAEKITTAIIPALSFKIISVENGYCPFTLEDLKFVYKNLRNTQAYYG